MIATLSRGQCINVCRKTSTSIVPRCTSIYSRPVVLASRSTALGSEAVLAEQAKRELETVARRQAYEAQAAAQQAAEKCGLSWWEVDCPANMVNVQSLAELQALVEAETTSNKLVVVNFFAPECYACKSLQPKLRQIARDNPDALFLKVNGLVGDLMEYVEAMEITRIPYFHFYKNNKRVAEFSANMRPEKLALLRAEIAAHKEQPMEQADAPQYQMLEA
eukprot:GHUV01000719.1.p1 GENE.GHUV01000719.1~~GHUV01000719.1.p1  ORF type:complete len:220 (+),score=45.80 GHUV01000719.1:221-880(+)